ncbi:MAG: cellulase family protein, partial [Pseudonocardiales bacterium]|nr:cellulase family protein [Pseudonocardiales bacterium]
MSSLRTPYRLMIISLVAALCATAVTALSGTSAGAVPAEPTVPPAFTAPLHTSGVDTTIYDATNKPVRLIGFNWGGTEQGGRSDNQKIADVCGTSWRTPADQVFGIDYNNMYQVIRDMGYNVIRVPVSWNNLRPVAPVWSATTNQYVHTWNDAYINDLKSMVSKAKLAGLGVIFDMHQDFWSPALHNVTNWDGAPGYCEGVGMPRWLNPSIDSKATTSQSVDYYNAMNWFFRNLHDPQSTVTKVSPWALFYSVWDQLSYVFSSRSGFADYQTVVGADILNEPYASYVGGSPDPGQTVLQSANTRLLNFYNAIAPAITNWNPSWLLFFEDCTGGYNTDHPDWRESPAITAKPSTPANWVYSIHIYDTQYGTFNDGVPAHDDLGITFANKSLANAKAWRVPLYVGEFYNFSKSKDSRLLTDADMGETKKF